MFCSLTCHRCCFYNALLLISKAVFGVFNIFVRFKWRKKESESSSNKIQKKLYCLYFLLFVVHRQIVNVENEPQVFNFANEHAL